MNSLIYNAGTVSVSGGSAIVEGNLTGWFVALVEGGVFSCDGLSIPILTVEDDTHLTLAYAWPGANGSGKEYAIARTSSEATARAATWTVDRLGKLAQTPWGVGVVPDGRGTLAQRDALNPMPNDDYCWLRVEVDEPAELYFREGGQWLGPYPFQGEPGPASGGDVSGPLVSTIGNAVVFGSSDGENIQDAGFAPIDPAVLALALDDKADAVAVAAHVNDTANPHAVTADQVGAATPGKAIALAMIFGG